MASEKITAIIDSVKELSVLELKELIDAYCEEFGVSAVAAAAPAAAAALPQTGPTSWMAVVLASLGSLLLACGWFFTRKQVSPKH